MKWDGNFSLYKVLRNKTYVNYKYRFTDNSTVKLLEKSRGNMKYISGWRLLFDKLRCYETTLMMLMLIEYGRSYQTKDCKIGTGICCFSSNHAALRRKSKYWLAWFPDNVSEWGKVSISELLFQWASTIKVDLIIISLNINFYSSWYSWTKLSWRLTTITDWLDATVVKKGLKTFVMSFKLWQFQPLTFRTTQALYFCFELLPKVFNCSHNL
jgi:hypothetical protein